MLIISTKLHVPIALNLQGLPRPVMRLLYLYKYLATCIHKYFNVLQGVHSSCPIYRGAHIFRTKKHIGTRKVTMNKFHT
jgi:hypothetical protein